MAWTPEKVKELKKLWKKGLTTVEIGRLIGISKNAVVGKAHRLGLESRPSPIKRDEGASSKKKIVSAPSKKKKEAISSTSKNDPNKPDFGECQEIKDAPITKESAAKGVKLVDLKPDSCRWPLGDPKDPNFCFCGKEVVPGKVYCEEHCAVAYSGVFKAR